VIHLPISLFRNLVGAQREVGKDHAWTFPSRKISATRREFQLDNIGKGKLLQ